MVGGYPAAYPSGQLKLSQFAPGKLVEPNGGSHILRQQHKAKMQKTR